MSDFPAAPKAGLSFIGPTTDESGIKEFQYFGATSNSAAWGASAVNKAIFMPFVLNEPVNIVGISWFNGSSSPGTGNIDAGVYDLRGNRLVSTGSTAQAAPASTWQIVDTTDLTLNPGYYFMAFVANNASTSVWGGAGMGVYSNAAFGYQAMASAFPLPAIATFAQPTNLAFNFVAMYLLKKLTF